MLLAPSAQAAVITHTLTGGSAAWSASTWTNGAPTTAQGPGDSAVITQLATVNTSLDINATVGTIRSSVIGGGANWNITTGAGSLTLDNTGSAGAASIITNGSGNISVAPNILLTNTDVILGQTTGAVANTSVTIGGNITAGASETRKISLRSTVSGSNAVIINGSIGATGSTSTINIAADQTGNFTTPFSLTGGIGGASGVGATVTISNTSAGSGALSISGALGASVTSVTQNSSNATGKILLSGVNSSYVGATTLTAGILQLGSTTALGGNAATLTINGGSLDSTVANLVLANTNAITANNDFTFVGTQNLSLAGTVSLGSTAGSRTITTTANTLTLTGVISDGVATSITKAGAGVLTLSGNNNFTGSVTVNAGSGSLNLNGANAFSGGLNLNSTGINRATSSTALNTFLNLGTGTITFGGASTLELKADGTGGVGAKTIITGNGTTGNNVVINAATTIDVNSVTGGVTNGTFQFNNLTIGNTTLTASNANAYALQFAGTTTLTGNATFSTGPTITLTGAIGDGSNGFGLTKRGTGILVSNGNNSFTGATVVGTANATTNGGTFTVSGASGSIATSSSYTVHGSGSQLNLDYSAGAATDRLGDGTAVTLNHGGELRFTNGTNATNTSETFGTLTLGTAYGFATLNQGGTGGAINAITSAGFDRGSNFATAVIRGTALGAQNNTNRTELKLTSTAGLTLVGTTTSASGVDSGTVKNLTIVPYLTGASSSAGTSPNLLTYDTTSGFRTLGTNEQSLIASGATNDNVKTTTTNTITAGAKVFNSLVSINSSAAHTVTGAGGGGDTLTLTSGVLANLGNGNANSDLTIQGFSSIIFGGTAPNGVTVNEAIITMLNTASGMDTFIRSAINTASAGGGLTKAGAGNVTLTASNLYTGLTTINQGVLTIGNGTTGTLAGVGDAGAVTTNVGSTLALIQASGTDFTNSVVNRGSFNITNAGTQTLSGNISGAGAGNFDDVLATFTLNLSGTNTYTDATTVAGTLNLTGSLSGTAIAVNAAGGLLAESGTGSIGGASSLTVSNATAQATLAGSNTYTGNTSVSAGTISLTGSLSGTNITVSSTGVLSQSAAGSIAGTGNTLTHSSSGTSTLDGTNTYTGTTSVSAGALNLGGSLTGTNISTSGTGAFTEGTAGVIGGAGNTFTQGSSVTSTLSGVNTYGGGTTVTAGTLALGNNSSLGGGVLNLGTGASTTLTIQSTSASNRTFTNDATFTVNSGQAGTANFGTVATGNLAFGSLTTAGTGGTRTAAINNAVTTFTDLNGTLQLNTSGTGALLFSGNWAGTGSLAVGNSNLVGFAGTVSTAGGAPNITLGGGGVFGWHGTMSRILGTTAGNRLNWTAASSGGFAGYGSTAGFGGANNFNIGFTTTLLFGGAGGQIASGQALVFGNALANGTVDFTTNLDFAAATQTIKVDRSNIAGASDLDARISGVISNGSLTKTGAGALSLTNTNTYTGTTTVSAGTLLISSAGSINSSSGVSVTGGTFKYDSSVALSSNVTVNGGRFSYNSGSNYTGALTFTAGTVGGSNLAGVALNIGAGQVMAPGNSTGTLAAGATSWDNGGTFVFELNNATGTAGSTTQGWDLLDASTLGITAGVGQFTLQIVSLDTLQAAGFAQNFNDASSYSWLFVDAGASITGFSAGKFVLDASAFQNSYTGSFSVRQGTGINDDKLYLDYAAIPEPATWALLAFSLTTVVVLRRRRG